MLLLFTSVHLTPMNRRVKIYWSTVIFYVGYWTDDMDLRKRLFTIVLGHPFLQHCCFCWIVIHVGVKVIAYSGGISTHCSTSVTNIRSMTHNIVLIKTRTFRYSSLQMFQSVVERWGLYDCTTPVLEDIRFPDQTIRLYGNANSYGSVQFLQCSSYSRNIQYLLSMILPVQCWTLAFLIPYF